MQTKTISKTIKKKLEEWLLTISDSALSADVKKNLLVSGGCIVSLFRDENVNDYDIYLQDVDVLKRLAEYYTKSYEDSIKVLDGRLKSTYYGTYGTEENTYYATCIRTLNENQIKLLFLSKNGGYKVEYEETPEHNTYKPLFFSPNAISLSDNLQIVLRFYGTPEEIHKTFDFVHATNYFTFGEGLVTNLNAIQSILTRQLKYQGSLYPLTSIIRAKKFIKRGFNISAGELLKIMYQISKMDLDNPDVLEEQLIGVDVAYFQTFIEALRSKYDKDKTFKLTEGYFNVLIDKIFDSDEGEE